MIPRPLSEAEIDELRELMAKAEHATPNSAAMWNFLNARDEAFPALLTAAEENGRYRTALNQIEKCAFPGVVDMACRGNWEMVVDAMQSIARRALQKEEG